MKHDFDIDNIDALNKEELNKLIKSLVKYLNLKVKFEVNEENKTYDFIVHSTKQSLWKRIFNAKV